MADTGWKTQAGLLAAVFIAAVGAYGYGRYQAEAQEKAVAEKVFNSLDEPAQTINFDFHLIGLSDGKPETLERITRQLDEAGARKGFSHCYIAEGGMNKDFPPEGFGPAIEKYRNDKFIAVDIFDMGGELKKNGNWNDVADKMPVKSLTYATRCPASVPTF